jgi:pimeloyl-ACP methyl ester carboxylesterase
MGGMRLTETFGWRGSNVRWRSFGDGPPVVLCHGTPWSSFVWRGVIGPLSTERTVYVWDMLGYGQSDKPNGDVSLAAQGELLADLIEHWRLDQPDVIAHDFGGAVTLRAHLLGNVSFRSIMLVDVVALRPWGSPFFRLVRNNVGVFVALPARLHEALIGEYISGASHAGLRTDVLEALVAPWLGDGQEAFYRQIAQADESYTAELEPLLGSISVPTAIVWGVEDTWIPVEQAHRLAAAIPGSTLTVIEGAGHLIGEDRPGAFAIEVDRWLRG